MKIKEVKKTSHSDDHTLPPDVFSPWLQSQRSLKAVTAATEIKHIQISNISYILV